MNGDGRRIGLTAEAMVRTVATIVIGASVLVLRMTVILGHLGTLRTHNWTLSLIRGNIP